MAKNLGRTAQEKSSIPKDIIYEIFSRLPIKSLTRFKCVSRSCNSLLSFKFLAWTCPQKKFYTIERNSQVPDESELIGQTGSTHKKGSASLINELNGFSYHKLDYIEGLFCFWNPSELPPIIFNPSTREVTSISCQNFAKDEIHEYHIMLGFDPEKKKYKIFMMKYRKHSLSSQSYWIFSLGTRESWREIKPIINSFTIPPFKGVCIDGVIYFVVCSHNRSKMATFDCRTENFRIIWLWNEVGHNSAINIFYYRYLVVEGKLAIVDVSRGETGVMVLRILQNSETEEWVNHTIVFPQLLCREVAKEKFCYLKSCVCSDTLNGEIVLINSSIKPNCIFFYDLKKNSWREIEVLGLEEKDNIFGICSYVESLLPLGYI